MYVYTGFGIDNQKGLICHKNPTNQPTTITTTTITILEFQSSFLFTCEIMIFNQKTHDVSTLLTRIQTLSFPLFAFNLFVFLIFFSAI